MKEHYWLLIRANGAIEKKDTELTLEEQQEFVGGYIEKFGAITCNEDGQRLSRVLQRNSIIPFFIGNIIFEVIM